MKEYYLTYNTGCGLSAYTGNDKTPFYIGDKPIKFRTKREALKTLSNILNKWDLTRGSRKHFFVIPTESAIIVNKY